MVARSERLLHHIRRLVSPPEVDSATDAALLERFVRYRDEGAFAALVSRHGPMVLGVCRRMLGDAHDAEDAAQAAFLVLARRAGTIRPADRLAAWLYGVARHLALKCRRDDARRRRREGLSASRLRSAANPLDELTGRELLAVLDEEVQRLPEVYRLPVLLCCLEGLSQEEAARRLGWTPGSVKGRLERGRARLQARLVRRGLTLSAALGSIEVSRSVAAAGWPMMQESLTVWAGKGTMVGDVSARVAALASGGLNGTIAARVVGVVFVLAMAAAGAGVLALQATTPQQPEAQQEPGSRPKEEKREVGTDFHGDPLPPGAVARLGTLRQRAPDAQLAVTADGKEVVAVSPDLTVRRFDARTGVLRTSSRLFDGTRYGIWLSPRGTHMVLCTYNGAAVLELWELAPKKRLGVLPLPRSWPANVAFSADERWVAFADSTRDMGTHRVSVWDVTTGKTRVLWSLDQRIGERYFNPVVVPSPDGKRLVAAHLDRTLRCWEVENGKLLWQSEGKTYTGLIFFRPDSRAVVSTAHIGTPGLGLLDAATGRVMEVLKPPKEAVYPLGFTSDGDRMLFETGFGGVVLWRPGAAEVALRFPPPWSRYKGHVTIQDLPNNFALTPDGKGLVRRAGSLQRWDLTTGKAVYADTERWGHTAEVTRLLFSPDGTHLASASKDDTARLWRVSSGQLLHSFAKITDHLAFTPDGGRLLAVPPGFGQPVLRTWDVASGREGRGFEPADRAQFMPSTREAEIRVTPDGKRVILLTWKNGRRNDECMIAAWDMVSGKCLRHERVPWAQDSVLTSDGEGVLEFDSLTGAIRLREVRTGQVRLEFPTNLVAGNRSVQWDGDLALSPDGRLMATRIHLLDRQNGRQEHEDICVRQTAQGQQILKVPVDGPAVFAFSADNRLIAVARTFTIELWEMASGRLVGHINLAGPASCLALSPDGRTIATGHADSTILLWDATLGASRAGPIRAAEVDALWNDLGGSDAGKANAARWRFVAEPGRFLPLIANRLRPVKPPGTDVIRKLLGELNSDQFAVRQAAEKALRELGERAEPALREALKAAPPLELRRRIDNLLENLTHPGPLEGENLRGVRAVQILEGVGSREAREVLEKLAKGMPEARLTKEAKTSLERLAR